MKHALAIGLAMMIATPALANPPKSTDKAHKGSGDDDDDDDDDTAKAKKQPANDSAGSADSGDDDDDDDDTAAKATPKAAPADATTAPAPEMQKQDLTGHDMATNKKSTAEEKDRFFVDKVDTDKTKDTTLVQGSLTLSTFFYGENSGPYGNPGNQTVGNDSTAPSIYWGDLRLQTDFRHISGGRWDGRVDFRARFVNTPNNDVIGPGTGVNQGVTTQPNLIQSGLLGQNEYDLRELWLIRNGEQTDLIFGRQYIPDLGAIKIDGLRVDYASSQKLTYLGFAGLYPLRGSRSLSTDYTDVKDPVTGADDGRFTGAGGFGGAYRTQQAYGSVGAVVLQPFAPGSVDQTRLFVTSTGYWRVNPMIDFYHFALVDVVSSYGSQLTNLSVGLNYKPTQRLRLTASFNRVDTDTLNVQAQQFLTNPGPTTSLPATGIVLNEFYIQRIATNEARASISAALGHDERFQVTAAIAYRERPDITLDLSGAVAPAATTVTLKASSSIEAYASFTDRTSFKDMRLGIDGLDSFPSDPAYDRVGMFSIRGFAGRPLESGKGEWEAELSYSQATDTNGMIGSGCLTVDACYGASQNDVISLGGTIYYRLNRDWFVLGSAYLQRTVITYLGGAMGSVSDAPIDGITGFGRIAYRF